MKTLLPLFAAMALLLSLPVHAQATQSPPAPTAATPFSLDTPIEELAAHEGAKAALTSTLPGLLEIPQYEMIKGLSLRQLQPYSGGKLTDELLARTEMALAGVK
ncbi:hypothetical protein [Niveispirillum sp.]|uniref:hypothetical protein n=1 Tax=Niveispirillum sp. TaxID=1917217 RepID=UPI001B74B244|nr:hypothetical protein [Niveispirillum sp.]MBP7335253.1 hypothetical protein [Niveispirillum sp.]